MGLRLTWDSRGPSLMRVGDAPVPGAAVRAPLQGDRSWTHRREGHTARGRSLTSSREAPVQLREGTILPWGEGC